VFGLDIEKRDGVRFVVSRWLVAPGAAATTVGRVVFIRRGSERSARLIRHEREHVRQYAQLGIVGFFVRYLRSYVRLRSSGHSHWAAYRRIPLEIEAAWRARLAERDGIADVTTASSR
jgi:hypothetical protein